MTSGDGVEAIEFPSSDWALRFVTSWDFGCPCRLTKMLRSLP